MFRLNELINNVFNGLNVSELKSNDFAHYAFLTNLLKEVDDLKLINEEDKVKAYEMIGKRLYS